MALCVWSTWPQGWIGLNRSIFPRPPRLVVTVWCTHGCPGKAFRPFLDLQILGFCNNLFAQWKLNISGKWLSNVIELRTFFCHGNAALCTGAWLADVLEPSLPDSIVSETDPTPALEEGYGSPETRFVCSCLKFQRFVANFTESSFTLRNHNPLADTPGTDPMRKHRQTQWTIFESLSQDNGKHRQVSHGITF